eukprot:scaffold4338_cov131-Isochrysis_galbana.AAC.1
MGVCSGHGGPFNYWGGFLVWHEPQAVRVRATVGSILRIGVGYIFGIGVEASVAYHRWEGVRAVCLGPILAVCVRRHRLLLQCHPAARADSSPLFGPFACQGLRRSLPPPQHHRGLCRGHRALHSDIGQVRCPSRPQAARVQGEGRNK